MGSYDADGDRWLFIGEDKTLGREAYLYPFSLTLDNGEERYYEVIEPQQSSSHVMKKVGGIVLIISLLAMIFLFGKSPVKMRLKTSSSIMLWPDLVLVDVGGEMIQFTESTNLRFWNYVMDLKSKNIHHCELKDFDEQVLPSLSNESQYSVYRKRFISHVNEKLGLEFIEVKRSELDKRYRKVVFRHDLL